VTTLHACDLAATGFHDDRVDLYLTLVRDQYSRMSGVYRPIVTTGDARMA
jgi:hypothetical protein